MSESDDPNEEISAEAAEFEFRQRLRRIQVPTDDNTIKNRLRQMQEPICLFGEGPVQRRDRLRRLLAAVGADATEPVVEKIDDDDEEEEQKRSGVAEGDITWYHEGPEELRLAREWIARDSLTNARNRLIAQRKLIAAEESADVKKVDLLDKVLRGQFEIHCSQVGDTRPLSYCTLSPDNETLLTTSWSGIASLWKMPDCEEPIRLFRGGHGGSFMCSAEFHPRSTIGLPADSVANIATSGFDGTVRLWALEGSESKSIEVSEGYRVNRVRFHRTGRFLASCCHDESWRLYDLEADKEILHQEGHVGAVYDLAFQCDGSVCLTGGEDTYGRVWDLRSGRCIMFLNGHLEPMITTSFSPNGYQMASGGADNTVKIWDLRVAREQVTIAAHTNLVSQVKFQKRLSGGDDEACLSSCLMTVSYDASFKIWSGTSWNALKVLASGHEQRITAFDTSNDGRWLVTCSADRSFKVWRR